MLTFVKCRCGQRVQVNKQLAGRQIPCPYCHATINVPLPVTPKSPSQSQKPEPKTESSIDLRFLATLVIVLLMLVVGTGGAILFMLNQPEPVAKSDERQPSALTISKGQENNSTAQYRIEYVKKMWFALFDFEQKTLDEESEFSISYELTQGSPYVGDFVWVVEARNSNQPELKAKERPLESFYEFPFDPHSKQGKIKRLARLKYETESWRSFLALKAGTGRYVPVSGEIKTGALPTSRVPPTPNEQVKNLSARHSIALANARYRPASPTWELMVDYEIVRKASLKNCKLVAAGLDNERVEFEVGELMTRARKLGTLVVPKPKKKLKRPIVVYLETRISNRPNRLSNPTPVL